MVRIKVYKRRCKICGRVFTGSSEAEVIHNSVAHIQACEHKARKERLEQKRKLR
jgi:hypothetical protein